MAIYSGFTYWKLWFSIVMLVYQRVITINVTRFTTVYGDFYSYLGIIQTNSEKVMWVKQCHKPPMTGNGTIPPTKMVMTGGWIITVLPTLDEKRIVSRDDSFRDWKSACWLQRVMWADGKCIHRWFSFIFQLQMMLSSWLRSAWIGFFEPSCWSP